MTHCPRAKAPELFTERLISPDAGEGGDEKSLAMVLAVLRYFRQ